MNDKENICLKFLQKLKAKGKDFSGFEESVNTLQAYAASNGLEDECIDLLANVIISTDLSATKLITLIKCLVPKYKVPEETFKSITTWCLSSVNKLPITVSITIIQWIIGLWDQQLIDKKVINIYYSVLFYVMLKKERLDRHIAHLIYVLTKPEDVSRRDVIRLLTLCQKHSKPQRHFIALLLLFKTYKPELVPEKIQSINIASVWKPIPEVLQVMLQDARARLEIQQKNELHLKLFEWNKFEHARTRKVTPLLPSVEYYQIGSSIFKGKDTKLICNISSIEELGISHFCIELPSNATSLLTNTAGFHLLTFADFYYQNRFSYNLYNTLIRAFVLENEKFSEEEMNKLLDLTAEFSRYMQRGILVVNQFLDEYFYFNTGEYRSKILALLQWMTSASVSDLQEKVLVHIKSIYYELSLTEKCEIIRTLRMLITNLFINEGFEECYQKAPAPFLGQSSMNNFKDAVLILTEFSEDLIVSGLNIHSYDSLLLSEALSFYEEICMLETRSTIMFFILAPFAVIYGCFVAKSCMLLSRMCNLLLRYRHMSLQFMKQKAQKAQKSLLKTRIKTLSNYAQDIFCALWYGKLFEQQVGNYFSKSVSGRLVEDYDLNYYLNIINHYAILPYKCTLSKTGFDVSTKEDVMNIALQYLPNVNKFLATYHT